MKNKRFKIKPLRILRGVSQLLFFILLPGLFISEFASIKAVYLAVLHGTFGLPALLPQLAEIVAVIPATLLLGRFFCGWMCAFGGMEDFISFLSHKILKHRFTVPEKVDRVLKWAKYALLVFLVAAVWSLGVTVFKAANPWDAFGLLLTPGSLPDFSYVVTNLLPAGILLLLIIVASFFIDRFFCRYLCPLGAVFALTSKLRITSISKPSSACGKCRACTKACPMGIALYQNENVKSGECIDCFACVQACPRKNAAFAVSGDDVRPLLAGGMAVACMTGLHYAGSFEAGVLTAAANTTAVTTTVKNTASSKQHTASTAGSEAAASSEAVASSKAAPSSKAAASLKYKDGTYQGSGSGFHGGTTTVSVTVKNDKVTAVSPVSNGDTPDFFSRAFSTVVSEIISRQSTNVDAVSGATYSSMGIMQAVADALSQALN